MLKGIRSQAEVAAIMGCSRGCIHQIERNALRKLRRRLAPLFEEPREHESRESADCNRDARTYSNEPPQD